MKDLITKKDKTISRWTSSLILIVLGLALSGCASTGRGHTESMLSAAGFRAVAPTTARQRADYAALPPYQVERRQFDGQLVYAYADTNAWVVYIGNDSDYQRYEQLMSAQRRENQEFAAAQMDQDEIVHWGSMSPTGEPR